ncbi:MAG: hypothetical protein ABI835_14750 [Chloroflexota bacterium]
MIKRIVLLAILLMVALPVLAQDSGGQFWVQAFEDRNANATRDAGEPFLTRGVSVDLLNADGVVMASGTLDNAPYANQGFIGFLYLAPGNYTAVITAPDLAPTTPDRVDVTIGDEETPITVQFGAQRAGLAEAPAASSGGITVIDPQVARLALAGFGAMVVIGVMIVLGLGVYVLVLRQRAPVETRRTTTGSMRPVRVDTTGDVYQTGEFRGQDKGKKR